MPVYEYRCRECGHTFQLLQRVGASNRGVTCPACSSGEVERLVSCFASAGSGSSAGRSDCGPAAS